MPPCEWYKISTLLARIVLNADVNYFYRQQMSPPADVNIYDKNRFEFPRTPEALFFRIGSDKNSVLITPQVFDDGLIHPVSEEHQLGKIFTFNFADANFISDSLHVTEFNGIPLWNGAKLESIMYELLLSLLHSDSLS